jgi:hypothetical protein
VTARGRGRVAEGVEQHLTRLVGAKVEVTLEIRAELAEGAAARLVRDVSENCRTPRFGSYGLEEA